MNRNRNLKEYGKKGEGIAASFLMEKGFEIIERNFRFGKSGEIDLIALKENLLIFVEVKSRTSHSFGGPLYSINNRKKNTIRRVAKRFLVLNRDFFTKEIHCRFDMIAILDGTVEWIEDIFR